ncbi:hypothetical protein K3495_g9203 [Podosphaera aphanis]|nr:hypothetical protein K3495_g9203 [Podosphaera aphanis]
MALGKENDQAVGKASSRFSNKPAKRGIKTALWVLCLSVSVLLLFPLTHFAISITPYRTLLAKSISQERTRKPPELVLNIKPVTFCGILSKHMQDLYQGSLLRKSSNFPQPHHEAAHTFLVLGKRMTLGGTGSTPNATAGSIMTTATVVITATEVPTTVVSTLNPSTTNIFTSQTTQVPADTTSVVVKTTQLTETLTSKQTIVTSIGFTQITEPSTPVIEPGSTKSTDSPVIPGPPKSTESLILPGSPTKNPVSNDHSTSDVKGPGPASLTRPAISRQTIYTTTLPDGAVSTLTSITVIPATTEPIISTTGTKTNGAASLQTNHASNIRNLGPRGLVAGILGIVIAGVL